jgi:hypothetical protein
MFNIIWGIASFLLEVLRLVCTFFNWYFRDNYIIIIYVSSLISIVFPTSSIEFRLCMVFSSVQFSIDIFVRTITTIANTTTTMTTMTTMQIPRLPWRRNVDAMRSFILLLVNTFFTPFEQKLKKYLYVSTQVSIPHKQRKGRRTWIKEWRSVKMVCEENVKIHVKNSFQ